MRIQKLLFTTGRSGFFNEDWAAVKKDSRRDGFPYITSPVSPNFRKVLQPGEALLLMLVLEDGQVALGDCMDVIFTGVAGRDPLFKPDLHFEAVREGLGKFLAGKSIQTFSDLATQVDAFEWGGHKLHTAIRYGISQALLHACALSRCVPMARIVADEYGTIPAASPVPILASCATHDAITIDRMIEKRADILPHGEFPDANSDLGKDGEVFLGYVRNLVERIKKIGPDDYAPGLHFDMYGSIGELFNGNQGLVVDYLRKVQSACGDLRVMIETPVVMTTQAEQIEYYRDLRVALRAAEVDVELVVDEWCNTYEDVKLFVDAQAADFVQVKAPDLGGVSNSIDAILYAKRRGVGACMGGSGNETEHSTRVTTNIALALGADFMLSKPGFGGDEALMIQTNEMQRVITLLQGNEG